MAQSYLRSCVSQLITAQTSRLKLRKDFTQCFSYPVFKHLASHSGELFLVCVLDGPPPAMTICVVFFGDFRRLGLALPSSRQPFIFPRDVSLGCLCSTTLLNEKHVSQCGEAVNHIIRSLSTWNTAFYFSGKLCSWSVSRTMTSVYQLSFWINGLNYPWGGLLICS